MYAQPRTTKHFPIREYTANKRTVVWRSDGAILYKAPTFPGKPHFIIFRDDVTDSREADARATGMLLGTHSCCVRYPACGCDPNATVEIKDYNNTPTATFILDRTR